MAHTYASLYGLPVTGLRFFTVYGPFGRPDMALFLFTKAIFAGQADRRVQLRAPSARLHLRRRHRRGRGARDGPRRRAESEMGRRPARSGTSKAPYRIYNIGNQQPVELLRYIEVLEECLGRKAEKNLLPLQQGDVPDTWADVEDLVTDVGYRPEHAGRAGRAQLRRLVSRLLQGEALTLSPTAFERSAGNLVGMTARDLRTAHRGVARAHLAFRSCSRDARFAALFDDDPRAFRAFLARTPRVCCSTSAGSCSTRARSSYLLELAEQTEVRRWIELMFAGHPDQQHRGSSGAARRAAPTGRSRRCWPTART